MNRNRMLLLTICTAVILVLTGCTSTPNPIDPNGRAAALSGTVVDEDSGLKLWSGTVEIPGWPRRISKTVLLLLKTCLMEHTL